MKKAKSFLCLTIVFAIIFASSVTTMAQAKSVYSIHPFKREEIVYKMSDKVNKQFNNIYKKYNFEIGWGVYDISGQTLKQVASYNVDDTFQSNCTIKASMLLYICRLMDKGQLSKDTKLYVNKSKLHYTDFPQKSGSYTVEYLLTKMINVSNNCCYEVLLRYVTKEKFNDFLKSIGSGTVIKSYSFMGNCLPKNRAIEWFEIYNYCHSNSKNSSFAWNLFIDAKFSPIRDGLERIVAHKSGWFYKKGTCGTAGDCAVVKSDNGGCYLVVIFTKNNSRGNYSKTLIQDLAKSIDCVWNEYYGQLIYPKVAKF